MEQPAAVISVPRSEIVEKNLKNFEIVEIEQKINHFVKKVAKVEKVDYIKMNKQQIRDRSAKVHSQKFLG